jgi:hypothetical protein
MDILTLGKMNAMARDVNVTLEYLANSTFQALKDTCDVQEGMTSGLDQAAQDAVDTLNAAGPNIGTQTREFYNDCARGCCCFCGCQTNWTVPEGVKTIKFEAWGGGGAGAGHCCQGCYCDIGSCAASGGMYSRKTICQDKHGFDTGTVYQICLGDGGNGSSRCWTACCGESPTNRGCITYVQGTGLVNFCAIGGRGGYNIYCTCQCNMNICWMERGECFGQFMCSPNQCNTETSYDWVQGSHGQAAYFGDNCHCGGRWITTGTSEGLNNSLMQEVGWYSSQCGCETPCRTLRHAGGGVNAMKARCGGWLCNCHGSPGKPGLVRITYS